MFHRKGKRLLTTRRMCQLVLILVCNGILVWIFLKITYSNNRGILSGWADWSSSTCIIPTVPLRSNAYNETVDRIPTISQCKNVGDRPLPQIQFLGNKTLELVPSDLYKREDCTAYEIRRPKQLQSDRHLLRKLPAFNKLNQIYYVTAEYVMVACHDFQTHTLQYSYHARLLTKNEPIISRIEHWEDDRGQGLPVNVVLLVLDSTSAADASRHLPLTMDFLKSKLNFIQFRKFHALGEPTMMNVLPLLTGTSALDTFKYRGWMDPWDNNYFIWKDFQNAHYVTSYIEDLPHLGTFNYGFQAGFANPPTDVYPRPLFTAWELNKKQRNKCIGDRTLWKFILDMELDMLHSLEGIAPVFSIPWLTWPFHDYFGTLSALDDGLLNFFDSLSKSPSILENTVFIVMADHGFYSHKYSNTHEGLLERRLPLFLIRIPENLKQQLPNISTIVIQNSERIVSHYDIYKTLYHLSQVASVNARGNKVKRWTEGSTKDSPGQSILESLPATRTCNDAQIPRGWCACNLPSPPPFSTQSVIPDSVLLNVDPFHSLRIRDVFG